MRFCRWPIFFMSLFLASGTAQWPSYSDPLAPRLLDGSVDLNAPVPKTEDGRPRLSGVWWVPPETDPSTGAELPPRRLIDLAYDLPDDAVQMRPQAARLFAQRVAESGRELPSNYCLPPGIPMAYTAHVPFKILENARQVTILYEYGNSFRQIFTDGRPLPEDPLPAWLGYSVGSWDEDTFVVETKGLNDRTWFDVRGHPHTEQLRLIERYRRIDYGHLEISLTIDDAESYLNPWTVTVLAQRIPEGELIEYVCLEDEQDVAHIEAAQ